MNKDEIFITTLDNPYDPFTDFTNWYMYDVEKGYDTCGYMARLSFTNDMFSDEENNEEIERVIDEIVKNDILGIYIKIFNEKHISERSMK